MPPLNNNAIVPHNVKILLLLWTLGIQESFRTIGDLFGMVKGDKLLAQHFILRNRFGLQQKHARLCT
jgi:hypothetical protein